MENSNLAAILKAYREENGYSIREMADILHMSKSAYDRLEKGLTTPSYEQMQRILELSQVKPDTFREIDIKGRPVGTIAYLKRGLLYGSISTDTALNCLADLAVAIGDADMLEWAKEESKGYSQKKLFLPPYRSVSSIFEMECEQDGQKFFLNLPSEAIHGKEYRNSAEYLGDIERIDSQWPVCGPKLSGLPDDAKNILESKLKEIYGANLTLIRAVTIAPSESIQKILLAVQEIILCFLQEVETHIGTNVTLDDLKAQRYLAGRLFQKSRDKVGSADHLDLPDKPSPPATTILLKGDEDSFCDWLDEHYISFFEMDEFFVLIEALEESDKSAGIVPPELCAWAKKVSLSNTKFREDDTKLLNGLKVFFGVEG